MRNSEDLKKFLGRINIETGSGIDRIPVEAEKYEEIERKRQEEDLKNMMLQNDGLMEENFSKRQDRELRKDFADNIFRLVVYYLIIVFFLVFLSSSGTGSFAISDSVLITILSTMTINVIGLLVIVVRYLFR